MEEIEKYFNIGIEYGSRYITYEVPDNNNIRYCKVYIELDSNSFPNLQRIISTSICLDNTVKIIGIIVDQREVSNIDKYLINKNSKTDTLILLSHGIIYDVDILERLEKFGIEVGIDGLRRSNDRYTYKRNSKVIIKRRTINSPFLFFFL